MAAVAIHEGLPRDKDCGLLFYQCINKSVRQWSSYILSIGLADTHLVLFPVKRELIDYDSSSAVGETYWGCHVDVSVQHLVSSRASNWWHGAYDMYTPSTPKQFRRYNYCDEYSALNAGLSY